MNRYRALAEPHWQSDPFVRIIFANSPDEAKEKFIKENKSFFDNNPSASHNITIQNCYEKLNLKEAAKLIHNRNYRQELNKEERAWLKESGIIAVYGASDDLIELDGFYEDEFGAPGKIYIRYTTTNGIYVFNEKEPSAPFYIESIFDPGGGLSWLYKTNINNIEWFDIQEENDVYCRGFVFFAKDLLMQHKTDDLVSFTVSKKYMNEVLDWAWSYLDISDEDYDSTDNQILEAVKEAFRNHSKVLDK